MHTDPIHLIGAGGHGRVVADALIAAGIDPMRLVFRDARFGLLLRGRVVETPEVTAALVGRGVHVALGAAAVRERLHGLAVAVGARPLTVVHPQATVSPHAVLGAGTFVAAGAVIAADTIVGEGTIVNHGAVVDHDCRVGAFAHIAPNATLGGGVCVGDRVLVGAGAVVLPGLVLGDDATIGAGAVVLRPIGAGETWVGNPAKRATGTRGAA